MGLEDNILAVLQHFGAGKVDSEVLENTPRRVVTAWEEMWRGLGTEMPKLTMFDGRAGQEILVKDIVYSSTCEHHLLPFWGTVDIRLLVGSSGRILGLSKYNRLVQWCASRPTLQERLCWNIYEALMETLEPLHLVVTVSGEHSCVKFRGIKDGCSSAVVTVDSMKVAE